MEGPIECFSRTSCHRLVKGTGEIIEEIVSKERQKQINKVRCMENVCAHGKIANYLSQ